VDSKFCRFCGAELPEEERVEAQLKLNELIAEGYRLFNDGQTDEALIVAESAISSSPNEARALSLKGMCLERAGNLVDALELYERVVKMNPDSALDKVKMTHVRNLLAAKAATPPTPNRRMAIVGAVAAVVFVMAVGAIIAAVVSNSAPRTASLRGAPTGNVQATGFDVSQQQPIQESQANQANQANNSNQNQTQSQGQTQPGGTTRLPALQGGIPGGIAQLPGTDGNVEIKPNEGPKPNDTGPRPPAGNDPEPRIDSQPSATEQPNQDQGTMDIKIYRHALGAGGSETADDSNQLKALLKAGRDQFQLGDYQAAARTFERAVSAGGDPAVLNQRIGQCYMNLGKKGEAANAYTKAVDAFQSELSSHDSPSLRAGLQSCKQALKVLRG
jgi:tetratricopeptide (TPR) repeat protein